MLVLWSILCYGSGAFPWSVWLGKLFFHVDPREQSDHNPGAANAFRAAGWRLGAAVLVLDFFKAFIPVAVAHWLIGFPAAQLAWLAFLPMIGHAFSIFLRFRGGRGIVVMFGVWAGLTLYSIPLVMGITAIVATFLIRRDEYRTLAIPLVLIGYLLLRQAPSWMILLACAQLLVLTIKIGDFILRQRGQRAQEASDMR